jgi:4-hydroxythreonine-4-phosphate dehydrogenase
MPPLPLIGLTMGDPAGVGPEVCLHALANTEIAKICNLVVFGDTRTLRRCQSETNIIAHLHSITLDEFLTNASEITKHTIIDFDFRLLADLVPGVTNANTGESSFQFIQRAIDAALANQIAAVVTAPINKEALQSAGHFYPGHTEIFAERCPGSDPDKWCMMQFSPQITCTFVTVHCGYADVPKLLTTDRIVDVIELTSQALWQIHGRAPKILVCGLNPHAGENGLFGYREEEHIIAPAIEVARARGIHVEGPLPPDTAFVPFRRQSSDAVVCMYHDQGHIPVKALAFDSAVNTTLGISVVRTSVDHGTACDISWQNIAKPDSLFAAIRLAVQLSSDR